MAVFVNLPYTLIKLDKEPRIVCQMVAHDIDELHEFARELGLNNREDFVNKKTPYYLISPEQRMEALQKGALIASISDLSEITKIKSKKKKK